MNAPSVPGYLNAVRRRPETSADTSFGPGVALGRVAAASVLARAVWSLTCVCADAGGHIFGRRGPIENHLGWGTLNVAVLLRCRTGGPAEVAARTTFARAPVPRA